MKKIFGLILFSLVALDLFVDPASALAASLALSPATATVNSGCSFSTAVNLDTAGVQTDGTDVILLYDPSRFTATSVTKGTLYPDYPVSSIDSQAGKISISGLASVDQPFTGSGTFATVNFTVAQNASLGATSVNFDFDPNNPGKTTDSNVVQRGTVTDVLSSVTNGNFTIGTGTCNVITPPASKSTNLPGIGGPVSSASATPTPKLPVAGSAEKTLLITLAGCILTVLGIAGLALL